MSEVRDGGVPSGAVRPAATVVLVRDGDRGVEAYLVRRGSRAAFMPDLHVYPGGRVDAADATLAPRMTGYADDPRVCDGGVGVKHTAATWVGAVRELFEEAGVLLARDGAGALLSASAALRADRERLNAGDIAFDALVAERGWTLDASELAVFDHWITPSFEKRRYDTLFLLAPMPEGQRAEDDAREVYDGEWWRPGDVLAAYRRREIGLAPPTFVTLEWLADARTVAEAYEAARSRVVVPILPELSDGPDGPELLLPGAPGHPAARAGEAPHRVRNVDGLWRWREA